MANSYRPADDSAANKGGRTEEATPKSRFVKREGNLDPERIEPVTKHETQNLPKIIPPAVAADLHLAQDQTTEPGSRAALIKGALERLCSECPDAAEQIHHILRPDSQYSDQTKSLAWGAFLKSKPGPEILASIAGDDSSGWPDYRRERAGTDLVCFLKKQNRIEELSEIATSPKHLPSIRVRAALAEIELRYRPFAKAQHENDRAAMKEIADALYRIYIDTDPSNPAKKHYFLDARLEAGKKSLAICAYMGTEELIGFLKQERLYPELFVEGYSMLIATYEKDPTKFEEIVSLARRFSKNEHIGTRAGTVVIKRYEETKNVQMLRTLGDDKAFSTERVRIEARRIVARYDAVAAEAKRMEAKTLAEKERHEFLDGLLKLADTKGPLTTTPLATTLLATTLPTMLTVSEVDSEAKMPFPFTAFQLMRDGSATEPEHASHRWSRERFTETIEALADSCPRVFNVQKRFLIGDKLVEIGSLMALGGSVDENPDDTGIPVYITDVKTHTTSLVIAYRSESQISWRRFAGRDGDHYCKGKTSKKNDRKHYRGEHYQDLDWRIQKTVDGLLASTTPTSIAGPSWSKSRMGLMDLSPESALVVAGEERIQKVMDESAQYPIFIEGEESPDRPARVIDYWKADSPAYGEHYTVMMLSPNHDYLYAVALTAEGMFVKYVQDTSVGSINMGGSPARGVRPKGDEDTLRAPRFEYEKQVPKGVEATPTVSRARSSKHSRIYGGLHETGSLAPIQHGFDDIYRKMRHGEYGQIEQALEALKSSGIEIKGTKPTHRTGAQTDDVVGKRTLMLVKQFQKYREWNLGDPISYSKAASELQGDGWTPYEISLVLRYAREFSGVGSVGPESDIYSRVFVRMELAARMWVEDELAPGK